MRKAFCDLTSDLKSGDIEMWETFRKNRSCDRVITFSISALVCWVNCRGRYQFLFTTLINYLFNFINNFVYTDILQYKHKIELYYQFVKKRIIKNDADKLYIKQLLQCFLYIILFVNTNFQIFILSICERQLFRDLIWSVFWRKSAWFGLIQSVLNKRA